MERAPKFSVVGSKAADLGMIAGTVKAIKGLSKRRDTVVLQERMEMENLQQAAVENRQLRSRKVTFQHNHVLDMVSFHMQIPLSKAEEGLLDDEQHIDILDSLFSVGGTMAVICSYYLMDSLKFEDCGRTVPEGKEERLIFSDGTSEKFFGKCVIIYRVRNDISIEMKNMADDLYFIPLNVEEGETAVHSIKRLLTTLYKPVLSAVTQWGELDKTLHGTKAKDDFFSDFDHYINFLTDTTIDLGGVVVFDFPADVREILNRPIWQLAEIHSNAKVVMRFEEVIRTWSKKITYVLTQSQQLRSESENVGPSAEITHWRRQLAVFTSIIEHIKSNNCQTILKTLVLAKSKVIKKWSDIENTVTEVSNEAQDNVKYLYTLEKFYEPLYRTDPTEMGDHIPSLMYVVKMIYITSRYYNTPERITPLLTKITNQMVITCKKYISKDGRVFDQAKGEMIHRMDVCSKLYNQYRKCYEEMKKAILDSPDQIRFEVSEMYIFSKFETFKKRMDNITDLLATMLHYSILHSSRLEGIDIYAGKIDKMFQTISSRDYDVLDHRKVDFDKDYSDFKKFISEVETELRNFLQQSLDKTPDVYEALRLIARFEKLQLPCLRLDKKYMDILDMTQKEIEKLRDYYNEERGDPPIPFNMPPIAGRIFWIRNLQYRLDEPMNVLKEKEDIMASPKARHTVKLYNALAACFKHYEIIYHKAWHKHVGLIRIAVSRPILLKFPDKVQYSVNFDNFIIEVIRETEYMWKLGLEVPDAAQVVTFTKKEIMDSHEQVKALVKKDLNIRENIQILFTRLLRAVLYKMQTVFLPGLSEITWTSLNIPEFCQNVNKVLNEVEIFMKRVSDLTCARIDDVFEDMSRVNMIFLPEAGETLTPIEFVDKNVEIRDIAGKLLESKSQLVEKTVVELINLFTSTIDLPQAQKDKWMDSSKLTKPLQWDARIHTIPDDAAFQEVSKDDLNHLDDSHSDCIELFAHFDQKVLDALVKATRHALESLRKRTLYITGKRTGSEVIIGGDPIFSTYLVLEVPKIVIRPSIEVIQEHFSQTIACVLETHNWVIPWGWRVIKSRAKKSMFAQEDSQIEENMTRHVTQHQDIVRALMGLSGAMMILQMDIENVAKQYLTYSRLWARDKKEKIKEFVEKEPIIQDIIEEFENQKKLAHEIENIPEYHIVGAIKIFTEKFKSALLVECNHWKDILGSLLSAHYKTKLDELVEFIGEKSNALQRKIKDLDGVRLAMACLESVRENFIRLDMSMDTMEDIYNMFSKYDVPIPHEDIEKIDSLRYSFQNMLSSATDLQIELVNIQEPFRLELLAGVEGFREDVEKFNEDFEVSGPMVEGIEAREASDRVLLFQARFDDLWRRFEMYSSGEKLFGMEVQDYPILHQRKREFNLLNRLYSLYNTVMNTIDGYYELLWTDIDIKVINEQLQDFQYRCRALPKGMRDWPAYLDLKKKIEDFNETIPLLELMTDEAIKDRHWARLSQATNYVFEIESEAFSLRNVMEAPLLQNKEEVEDICIGAVKEKEIEARLKQIVDDWSVIELQFAPFKNKGELLLKGTETSEIITLLEDGLMVLASLFSNRYNVPFKTQIQEWIFKLTETSEILDYWIRVQNLWIYLEAVFVGGDIAKQMPAEAKRFSNIDRTWIKIMQRAHEMKNVVQCCVGDDTMRQLLPHLLEQLESCQKQLTGYLEAKRLIFPRFFFVSDPALLEILGQASDSHTIQNHLLSVFDNVAKVQFHETDYDRILAVLSRENEKIPLDQDVLAVGGVEIWLGTLLEVKIKSMGTVISNAADYLNDPEFDVLYMLDTFPAQIGLLGLQLLWTRDSEVALKSARIDKTIMKLTNTRFLDLLNLLIEQTIKDLSKFDRVKYETCVTIHIHQRDIFDELVKTRIRSVTEFDWLKQGRFYFDEDKDAVIVSITDVDFIYQNEFLGCTERLVITPLTDRCYITLAQALGMSMGGAPAGPAGTGKTETTKDMGKKLGKYVVVFNCSDQMDFRGLGRIFKGLAQSGAWGCFDEFNRIELPVLSVAAQQIFIVLSAKKERKKVFVFSDGDTVSLDPEFGLFLTMNPGYAGRQELPENLKINFRTVAMMVPDRHIIIRVKLASCGFKENITLSRKFYTLYKLCEEQLSKQVHYDFGLRNMLSVLRTLGAQRRAHPGDSEEATVMRVLREMNLSKLVDEDEPLFVSLVSDLFPGLKLSVTTHPELQKAIENTTKEMMLINHLPWNLKVQQFYETSLVRHGLMALGPTGAGKTTMIHTLMKALTETGRPHREMRMNPKAITAPQMFGRLDVATNDWTDGIFSTLWRRTHRMKSNEHVWLVLDGPVDAVWIENLNSVLDDNKTLTLANGDRIPMANNCKLLFEPDNVDNASPATVSRMGMVFISSSSLIWRPILECWMLKRPAEETEILLPLFDKMFNELHQHLQMRLVTKMPALEAMYIRQCTDILQGIIDTEDGPRSLDPTHLHRLFLFAIMWSLGALLELDERQKLQEFVFDKFSEFDWPPLRGADTIFEFVVDDDGNWQHWNDRVEEYIYPTDSVPEYASILVPNVDNVRTTFLIDIIAKQKKPVLLIGEPGTAKTVMIKGYMAQYDPEFHLSKSFNFSSATTPNMFQRNIESYVDKRVGLTFGPPAGKKMTVFVDDINMPVINEWGDQVTNEIVRQLFEFGGFYSLDRPGDFSTIVDIQFIAAMIHPGGGRNDIPPRLKRQFCIFNCTLPSTRSMDKIFSVIAKGYFCIERFPEDIVNFVPTLVPLTRIMWQQTKTKMLPTPAKFHYVFNLRDLSRIWEGILYIKRDELPNITSLLKLWWHEATRVIADRFISEEDQIWFSNNLIACAKANLGNYANLFPKEPTYFVDFLREPPEATGEEEEQVAIEAPKIYEEIPDFETVIEKTSQYLESYNETVRTGKMDLVFFKDALVHLIKISRIIRLPRGNAMLVGVGGSGKQSLTRLATFIANYQSFQITLTRTYNVGNFLDDLKILYKAAGLEGVGMTFIFTDNDIKDEAFLEYLNNVLSAGEVANLFPRDELDEIRSSLIPIMKKNQPRRPPTPDSLYDYFIERARSNLHVVLCFSPVGEKFRSRTLKFPGLVSGCTMDWFFRWPREGLVAVSKHFLEDFSIACSPYVKEELISIMAEIQNGLAETCIDYFERFRRQTYVTPKSFLSFLEGYKKIYKSRLDIIEEKAKRMGLGLDKLVEAAESVEVLKKDLEVMNVEIKAATEKADIVLAEVAVMKKEAEKVKQEVEVVKETAQNLVNIIESERTKANKKLEKALPTLKAAEEALLTIKAADIATVRKLGRPPYLITLIMDAVIILFRRKLDPVKPDFERGYISPSWGESLKVMSDTRFLHYLLNFPKDTINEEIIDLLDPYLRYEQYSYDGAKVACGNVAGLIQWTIAMAQFYAVNKEVLPLKANLAVQQAKLTKAEAELSQAKSVLAEKQRDLDIAQEQLNKASAEKQAVEDQAQLVRAKLQAAVDLIEGLAGEKERWTSQSAAFKSEIERLVGDVIQLTAFLSYSGPFNQEYRMMLQKLWLEETMKRKIPVSPQLKLIDSLVDSATIGEWNLQGLPNDELSIQNGIIVTTSLRYPLMIDPQGQGKTWIRNMEKDRKLVVTTLNHKYFRTFVEDAISNGQPLLIEDVGEELDPILDNIMNKDFIKIGFSLKVRVGDKEVDLHPDFRLYITTQLPNPAYTPEVCARASIIDFTVTMSGLEDQLLGRVIVTEKKELETERMQLIQSVTDNKRRMLELEESLLHKLTTVEGSLVDDVSVINVLNVAKKTAEEVKIKLATAAETEIKINNAREEFRPVATRGSVLYFLIVDMAMVSCMYQTSLVQFLERFDISMARSEKSLVTQRRIRHIVDYLTFDVFRYKSRGLYEEHKYLFLLLMTLKIDIQRGHVSREEFDNFIKGGAALDLSAVAPKPCRWMTDIVWLNLVQLSNLRHFQYILSQVPASERQWKTWFDKEAPEEEIIPDGYETSLDVFRRLLMIRAWCPDRTLSQSRKYVESSMGERFNEPVITNFEDMFQESRPNTPIICFLSMGSDPSSTIGLLAKKLELKCYPISMGQGQEIHARKLMSNCMLEGGWVLMQNGHLGLSYMNEVFLTILEAESFHEDFRLWITTEVHRSFPISLLQISIKYTNDPPQGMRAGLFRTYSGISQDFLEHSTYPQYRPIIYAISFLHSVVQERRKFGPLGWNIPYEFNSADWYSSCLFVQNHLDDMDPKIGISWKTVRYMLGEVQYGGRVTDDYDKRLLNTFCKVWFSDSMFLDIFEFYTGYKIMNFTKVEDYLEAIDKLSPVDEPQVYGLHKNADIAYQSNTTKSILDQILNIQPKDVAVGVGETREDVVARMAQDMLEKLPDSYDPFVVRERLQIMGPLKSMNIFLRQEIDRMRKVIEVVHSTLTDLLLAIEGTIIMSEGLRDALDNIYDARIPSAWSRVSWVSTTLGFWFTELLERNEQFRHWLFVARPNMFWMTGFFNPQGFLTAMRQEVARSHKGWSLDMVILHNDVTKFTKEEVKVPPEEGVYVYGLFLDGASWDKKNMRLTESVPKILYISLPVMHIYAIFSTAPKDPKLYQCPVYKKPNRTDLTFITPLWLPTQKHPDHWIMRGVAILCDTK